MEEQLILVNEHNEAIGTAPKLKVHQEALLHRAFSVFVLRGDRASPELLLQRRALGKYHCGGLWTNTCCSHPREGETTQAAGERRLFEELGLRLSLQEVGLFTYRAPFDNGLTEHEIDHVLVGWCAGEAPVLNPDEVAEVRWIGLTDLQQELGEHPERFTPWFEQALGYVTRSLV